MRKYLFYLLLSCIPLIGFGQLLQQDFEGTTFPPTGWTITQTNFNETWVSSTWETGLAALVDYDFDLEDQDEWLISPSISLAAATDPYLSFSIGYSYYWAVDPNDNYDAFVKVSTDGGSTWTILWEDSDEASFTPPFAPINKSISLADYVGEANVKIAFQYSGVDGAALYVDNVSVGEGPVISYCVPTATFNDATGITNVTFGDISNPTGTSGAYTDYSSTMSTSVEVGDEVDLSVQVNTAGASFTVWASAWIDWDNDGDFTDETAINLGSVTGTADGATDASPQSITIPDVAAGEYRMRVRAVYGTSAVPTPCDAQSYSEAEDYTIVVEGGTVDPEPADYCTPEGTNVNRYIDNFSTTGGSENISNLASGFSDGGYGDFHETMGVSQVQGESVDFVTDIMGGIAGFRVWVDWNQDGEFDTTEEVAYQSVAYEDTQEGSITVPTDALLGDTRMRVVSHWLSTTGNIDPCATGFVYGEFEDYRFTVEAMADCSGTPEGGTVTVAPEEGNTGSEYTVSATDYTIAGGMSYQWQSNTDEAGWVDEGAASATYVDYTATAPSELDVVVEWRLAVTCVSSDETVYSDTASFTTIMEYCTPEFSNSSDYITDFQLEDIQNTESGFSIGGYGDFTSMSTDLEAGTTYAASLSSSPGSGNHAAAIWIDFDDNGTFDVSERVGTADAIEQSTTVDVPVVIPADAAEGAHRMRVVYQYGTDLVGTDISPCASASYGEGEDYTVNIIGDGGGEPEPGEGCFVTGQFAQYPSNTVIPSCTGAVEVITSAGWAGEYSKVQVSAGTEYIFSSSVATDFITIAEENEDVTLATGTGSVTWTSPTDQIIRFYTHADEDCTIEEVSRSRNVQCGDILPPPANDDCDGAIALSCGDTETGSTVFATDSGGNGSNDVFYTFQGNGTPELVTISLCGSSYDTAMTVYTDCSLTTQVATNDDSDNCPDFQSELSFVSDGTSTYIILVEGYSFPLFGINESGTYEITVSCGEAPVPPEACEDFAVLSNDLENGSLFGDQRVATDIPMSDTPFTIYGIEPTIVGEATSFEFILYSDEGGLPGTELETRIGTVTADEITGSNFGFDFHKYTIAFDVPLALDANTIYWLEIVTDADGWESTTAPGAVIGSPLAFNSPDTFGDWVITSNGSEVVFNFICEDLAISELNSFDFSYYPNPVKDVLNISAKKNVESVSVFNLAGQQLLSNAKVSNGQVDVKTLTAGTYVFRVTLEGGQVETFKVIKK